DYRTVLRPRVLEEGSIRGGVGRRASIQDKGRPTSNHWSVRRGYGIHVRDLEGDEYRRRRPVVVHDSESSPGWAVLRERVATLDTGHPVAVRERPKVAEIRRVRNGVHTRESRNVERLVLLEISRH